MHFSVMLFYYAVVASFCTLLMILGEAWIKSQAIRLFSYNAEQWMFCLLVSIVNFIGLNCQTIALQNERSGFITLLGYIGLVYAFMGDLFIFRETFQWLELVGVSIVLVLNVALICSKIPSSSAATPKQSKEPESSEKVSSGKDQQVP